MAEASPQCCERSAGEIDCSVHPGNDVVSLCTICNTLVCLLCMTSEKHGGHRFKNLKEAVEKSTAILANFIEFLKQFLEKCCFQKKNFPKLMKWEKDQKSKIMTVIQEQALKIKMEIDKICTLLLSDVESRHDENLNELDDFKKKVDILQSNASDDLQYYENVLKQDSAILKYDEGVGVEKRKKFFQLPDLPKSVADSSLDGSSTGINIDVSPIFADKLFNVLESNITREKQNFKRSKLQGKHRDMNDKVSTNSDSSKLQLQKPVNQENYLDENTRNKSCNYGVCNQNPVKFCEPKFDNSKKNNTQRNIFIPMPIISCSEEPIDIRNKVDKFIVSSEESETIVSPNKYSIPNESTNDNENAEPKSAIGSDLKGQGHIIKKTDNISNDMIVNDAEGRGGAASSSLIKDSSLVTIPPSQSGFTDLHMVSNFDPVYCNLTPTENDLAWATSENSKNLLLINKERHIQRVIPMEMEVNGLELQSEKGLLFATFSDKTVKSVDMENGQVKTLFTCDFEPLCVKVIPGCQLIVSEYNGEGFLHLYNRKGKRVKKSKEYFYAIDIGYWSNKILVCCGEDGLHVLKSDFTTTLKCYLGNCNYKEKDTFCCMSASVIADKFILVTDYNNRELHMLSTNDFECARILSLTLQPIDVRVWGETCWISGEDINTSEKKLIIGKLCIQL